MTGLETLWLPMVLSAVIVFVASSVIHMASPWHKGDYQGNCRRADSQHRPVTERGFG